MKKILSFVLLTALLLSCIAPALAVSAEGTVAISAPATVEVVGKKTVVKVDITLDDVLDGSGEIDLCSVWTLGALESLEYEGAHVSDYNVGTVRAGGHNSVKNNIPDGWTKANYNAALTVIEGAFVTGDVITAVFTIDAESFDYDEVLEYAFYITDVYDADVEDTTNDDDIVLTGAISFLPDVNYEAIVDQFATTGGPVFAVEDIVVPEGTTTCQIRVFLIHNNPEDYATQFVDPRTTTAPATGIWGTRTYLITPVALTVHNDGGGNLDPQTGAIMPKVLEDFTVGDVFLDAEFHPGIADVEIDSNKDLVDSWNETFGDTLEKTDYHGTCMYFQSTANEDNGRVLLNRYGDGTLLTLTIDLPADAQPGQVFPVKIAHWVGYTIKNIFGSDTSGDNNELVFPTLKDGSIRIEGEPAGCFHNNFTWTVTTPSTCTVAGVESKICDDCNEVLETRPLALAAHTPGEPTGVVAATCTTAGYTGDIYCTECSALIEEGTATALAAHTPGAKTTTVEPQVGVAGAWEIRCVDCDTLLDSGEIAALVAMNLSIDNKESDTQVKISVPVKIAQNQGFWAIGGTIDLGGLELTNIKKGLITLGEDDYSVTNGVLTFFWDNESIANITRNGTLFTLEFAAAAVGTYNLDLTITDLIDKDGNDKPFNSADSVVTVACQHVTEDVVTTAPTVTTTGILSSVCTKCGETLDTSVIPMLVGIVVDGATANCGANVAVPVSIVNNSGVWSVGATFAYDATALQFVDVTSDVFAITADSYSVANGVITVFAEMAAIENYDEDGVIFTLNFTSIGEVGGDYAIDAELTDGNTITCAGADVDAAAVDGTVTLVAHTCTPAAELVGVVEATCTTDGYTGDIVCDVCGNVIEAGIVVPALGHTPAADLVGVVEADYDNDGYTGDVVCDVCHEVITAGTVIPKLPEEEIRDGYYYFRGELGCNKVIGNAEDGYMFVKANGQIAVNEDVQVYSMSTIGTDFVPGLYSADENGILSQKSGIDNGVYWLNGRPWPAGVIVDNEVNKFVKNDGTIAVNEVVYIFSSKTNGIVTEGAYVADDEGAITVFSGIFNGTYYVEGHPKAAGVILDNGNLYFAKSGGVIAVGEEVVIYSSTANGLVTPGTYSADANGIITAFTGIKDGSYYENGAISKKGAFEYDGHIYFAKNDGKIAIDEDVYVYSVKMNGLVGYGTQHFDENGYYVAK